VKKLNRSIGIGVVMASLALLIPAGASAGQLDWDYKDSWYSYVHFEWTGPGTQGVHDVIADGVDASEVASEIFRHPIDSANTTYNPFTNTGVVAYEGSVRSLNEAHYIDIEFEDPQINVTTSTLTAVVNYRPGTIDPPAWGSPTSLGRVSIATFTGLASLRSTSGGVTTWTDAVPELTATGATVFAGAYPTGTAFGEMDFSTP
jgi:hypothetical protein